MAGFETFSKAVHDKFVELSKNELFITVNGDELWQKYLVSFPEGTDSIYVTNSEHNCNCCKQFVRNIGPVVSIKDGKMTSIWSGFSETLEYPYNVVAKSLDTLVINSPVRDLFRPTEPTYGAKVSTKLLNNGIVQKFNHLYGKVDKKHLSPTPDKAKGDYLTTTQVFVRGLTELKPSALSQVLELIDSNVLYRGAEHRAAVVAFQKVQTEFQGINDTISRNNFVWENARNAAARFRNTVIGTLVQDLSDGVELDVAVKSFESKVAPTNYKRTIALITPSMVTAAMKTLRSLDLEAAVERRFATISDVEVNNVLWVDGSVKPFMKGGVESILMSAANNQKVSNDKAQELSIHEFMSKVLPTASSMEMQFDNQHITNLVSITAPIHKDSGQLFKWTNGFGWSYNGNVGDSIKEKVKNAGGDIDAKVRVSLAWYNYDDLDIHAFTPNKSHIYFGNKQGVLDVDMNAGYGKSRDPVENLSWRSLVDGEYRIQVDQFRKRETSNPGFEIEMAYHGGVFNWKYQSPVRGTINVLKFLVRNGDVVSVTADPVMIPGSNSQNMWGLSTNNFVKVQTVMYSPNYWDDNAVGNKHWFFLLDGCKNPDKTRGMYNEFLTSKLEEHRKVFEVLGAQMMCAPSDDQLSGLGFSSTKQDNVLVKVTTAQSKRLYKVVF
jgi:hypothetical protein